MVENTEDVAIIEGGPRVTNRFAPEYPHPPKKEKSNLSKQGHALYLSARGGEGGGEGGRKGGSGFAPLLCCCTPDQEPQWQQEK